jgi:hypothetical protein
MVLVKMAPTDQDLWAAGFIPAAAQAALSAEAAPAGIGDIIKNLKGLYGSFDLSSGFSLTFTAVCGSPADATQLAALGNVGINAVKQQAKSGSLPMPPGVPMDSILSDLSVTAKDSTVTVAFNMTETDLMGMVGTMGAMGMMPGAMPAVPAPTP